MPKATKPTKPTKTIAVLCDQDHAGQAYLLARGLRDYGGYDAFSVRRQDTYMAYPTDYEGFDKYKAKIDAADFLIINDDLYWNFWEHFQDRPRLVKCHGTFTRHNQDFYQQHWRRTGTLFVTSPLWSLSSAVGFSAQHIPVLMDHRLLPKPEPPHDMIVVGCATRRDPTKGLDALEQFLQRCAKLEHVRVDRVEGLRWQGVEVKGVYHEGCLDRKKAWHVCADYIGLGGWGVNVVESLMMGQLCVANVDHWSQSLYTHDVPPFLTLDHTYTVIKDDLVRMDEFTLESCSWAMRNHDLSTQIPRWMHLIEWSDENWQKQKAGWVKWKPPSSSPTTPPTTKSTRRRRKRSKHKTSK